MPHPSDEDLALLALDEPLPGVEEHVQVCAACAAELRALSATVRTARDAGVSVLPPPPPAVWDRVAHELGLQEPGRPEPAPPAPGRPEPHRHGSDRHESDRRGPDRWSPRPPSRRVFAVAAGLSAAAAAVVAVAVLAGPADRSTRLEALGEVPGSGRVELTGSPERPSLLVETADLPRPQGAAYEVWLLDLEHDRIVPLGVLDDDGRAWVELPAGVEVADYPVVDVSLEPADGDPAHSGDSVLRGDAPA